MAISVARAETSRQTQDLPPRSDLDAKLVHLSAKYGLEANIGEIKRIIKCESGGDKNAFHRNKNGSVDYSYFQINEMWAKKFLNEYGLNIYIPDQNLEAGFILYALDGNKDWDASRYCWNK